MSRLTVEVHVKVVHLTLTCMNRILLYVHSPMHQLIINVFNTKLCLKVTEMTPRYFRGSEFIGSNFIMRKE